MSFSNIGNNKFSEYFSLIHIRVSAKSINFDNKNIKKSDFYKNKKLFKLEDIDVNKIFVSKKNHMVQKMLLNILLDTLIIMKLNQYV